MSLQRIRRYRDEFIGYIFQYTRTLIEFFVFNYDFYAIMFKQIFLVLNYKINRILINRILINLSIWCKIKIGKKILAIIILKNV